MAQGQREEVQIDGRKANLSEAKRRLLEQRVRGVASQVENNTIPPRPAHAKVPMSAEQRRVWLHSLQEPDVPIYNEPFTLTKHGSFDLRALEASLNEVISRHEALRSSFSAEGEVIIHPALRISLPLVDVSGLNESERNAEALRIATDDVQVPIAANSAPLLRAKVIRMSEDEHRLYVIFHHIILDGVAISRIFVPELLAAYAALERGETFPFPPPALQYGDYAIWRELKVDSPERKKPPFLLA